jgi:hypothetical protein
VSTVKIGSSAGTGGSVNNHNVWGLTSTAADSTSTEEEFASTGSSETVGIAALVLGIMATIAPVTLRARVFAQPTNAHQR